jgi:hypothetical protein
MASSPPRIRQLMPKTVIALESLQVVALASLHVVAPALIKHHLGTCSISCGTELILTACSSFLIKSLHQFERWIVYMTLYFPLCNITS